MITFSTKGQFLPKGDRWYYLKESSRILLNVYEINMGPNNLMKFYREREIIGPDNIVKQEYVDKGFLKNRGRLMRDYTTVKDTMNYQKVLISEAGIEFIVNTFLKLKK
jgi:hypothetical protein